LPLSPEPVIRLTLDLNVFVADLIAAERRVKATAASALVEAVRDGVCPAGPVQLVVSIPMLEALADVLVRKLAYPRDDAALLTDIIAAYASEGPVPTPPLITLGTGFIPFADEHDIARAIANRMSRRDKPLFDEIEDDRHVLTTALAGRADILVTANIRDFIRGPTIRLARTDVALYPISDSMLVIATPTFVRHWLWQGIIPDAGFINARPDEFPLERPALRP
jgi:hypothetical protein